jgi:hypothetical protein
MRKLFPIVAVAVFLICVVASFFLLQDFEIEISEADVQRTIDAQLEQGPIGYLGITLTIEEADVSFTERDGARLGVDLGAEGVGYAGTIDGDFASQIRYDAPRLYLADLKPLDFEAALDGESQEKIDDLRNIAQDFLKRQKNDMLSEEAKESLDRVVGDNRSKLKEIGVDGAYKFFEAMPIYNLKDAGFKGSAASLALKDIRFEQGKAIVTLSPLQAIIKILTALGIALLIALYFWALYFDFIGAPWRKKKEAKAASEEKT